MERRAGGTTSRLAGAPEAGRTASITSPVTETWRELGPVIIVVALAVAVLAGLAVLPARTWWTQRQNMNSARADLMQVEAEVDGLRSELARLQTDAEVERMARADYGLVFPGEESYRIVPPATTQP